MLAWNLWLVSADLELARDIASEIRRLPGVRSLAFDLDGPDPGVLQPDLAQGVAASRRLRRGVGSG